MRLDLSTTESNNVLLKFYGNPASSAIVTLPSTVRTGLVGIWGVSELNGGDEYIGDYLGKVMIEVGSKGVDSSTVLPAAGDVAYWIRHIGVQDDRALFPGMRVVGEQDEAAPVLVVDTMGYSQLIIEMRRVAVGPTLTTADPVAAAYLGFLYRFL